MLDVCYLYLRSLPFRGKNMKLKWCSYGRCKEQFQVQTKSMKLLKLEYDTEWGQGQIRIQPILHWSGANSNKFAINEIIHFS